MYKKLLPFFLFILFFQITKAQKEFITVWKPSTPSTGIFNGIPYSSSDTQIWLPTRGDDYTISWEEIGYPAHHAELQNVYSAYQILIDFGTPLNPNPGSAVYRVKVSSGTGNFHQIRFVDFDLFSGDGVVGDVNKIIDVEHWGTTVWSSMNSAFFGCGYLDISASDIPNLSNVTDMSSMFTNCGSLIGNPSFKNWDTSNVTTLQGTFMGAFVFNQPIGSWNTSNVTNMGVTFNMAKAFNQPLANWDTSKVETMTAMFNHALAFNQPIGNWDLSRNLDCEFMFSNALKFNQPIGNWDTSKVIEMNNMFLFAEKFNQDIGNWDTSSVKYMHGMFYAASDFNKNIGNWNTNSVITMGNMFMNASKFNQNIGSWNTSNVIQTQQMFKNAASFNQNLGNWNLSSIIIAEDMFLNSGLNCQNYDSTLYGWSQNPATPNNISLYNASPLVYSHSAAIAARNHLINTKGWTIIGDTFNGECASVLSTSESAIGSEASIYPNPAQDFIYIKNKPASENYIILDAAGRVIKKNILNTDSVNIQFLNPGNYMLQIILKDKIQSFKFIKK
ncbi:surface protein [Chryseobacterium sp. H1D6B]|uniref:BspA family leucine-rich repeat surface protein n=1 Tax=Chryseobacterium sp. H1D6B TaxID=2940588 RepID=UPI0015C720D0|nr:BspA family leucine-rich repeat surface protein [Chryseobacterium sp. H1D6B]MDH6250430.1 surface protein [Chryseobacterium sp. H1D6B]